MVFMIMGSIREFIGKVLKEVYGRGAYGVHELIKAIPSLRLLDTSMDARGGIVTWYRSEQDGKLYEVVISPMKASIHGVPPRLQPKQNTSEPFSSEQVKSHIETSMKPLLYGVNLVKDSPKYYDFVLMFDRRTVDKERFMDVLQKRTMVSPYTFKVMPNDAAEKVSLRYVKS